MYNERFQTMASNTCQLVTTTGTKLPDDIKRTFPDLIRLVGRESQDIVSVTLLLTLDIEGTGLEFPFCFTAGPSFVGEILAGVGELLSSFGGDLLSVADSFLLSFGI
jgi:hypothetical protein